MSEELVEVTLREPHEHRDVAHLAGAVLRVDPETAAMLCDVWHVAERTTHGLILPAPTLITAGEEPEAR